MCTAITYKTSDFYFGRTLDLERSYGERIVVTPRNYPQTFRKMPALDTHFSIIGMATVANGYPLYYDAANEKGLAMAGLNFPGNAHYFPICDGKSNITPFELIPYILGKCENLKDAEKELENLNLCNISFSESIPLSPLHWIIADGNGAVTVESTSEGLKIYKNPIGVLTNNPPFDYHMTHLCNYMSITAKSPTNSFGDVALEPYSRGMGGIGLPGDLSSSSRFVRAAFTKLNSVSGTSENESVSQFFHILDTVSHPKGTVILPGGEHQITVYTACINASKGIYYYTTYENRGIAAVNMHACNPESDRPIEFPLIKELSIAKQN